jgi:hypothetical protein
MPSASQKKNWHLRLKRRIHARTWPKEKGLVWWWVPMAENPFHSKFFFSTKTNKLPMAGRASIISIVLSWQGRLALTLKTYDTK